MSAWGVIKTAFFTLLTAGFFFIIWIHNPFAHKEVYELPEEAEGIVNDPKSAVEGRTLFKQSCSSCHSVRYDGMYLLSLEARPEWEKLLKTMGKPIIEKEGEKVNIKGYYLPRDVYEAVALQDLENLKASFGKVPPDLSTIYLARGAGYLYHFILDPQKVLPGTSMPKLFFPEYDKEAHIKVAKIVAYLKSVSEPPPSEKAKRVVMGVVTVGYFLVMGVILWFYRRRVLERMGLH
ncbi:MAG: cytochrome c1 [Aquificota bacterium]|nr:cytochrome c1 [Aquificota bacterium]